ncbi:MAG: FAD-binding protein [Lachnospiraceae bacterium]|nr:FAD-binding protein [Lachnospiraceae bacterium]
MKHALIIGSGISGMVCAVRCAQLGVHVTMVSPFPSERSQSVMAAGGINAVLSGEEAGDSVACHIEDTLKGGCELGGKNAVKGLCEHGGEILHWLESIGTVFSVDEKGRPLRRAFGGQSHKRTYYCGASTGKQIVSALVMEVRRFEAAGLIERRLWCCFHSALIRDGICYGAMLFDEAHGGLEAVCADALVIATGGQNALFGKTTGSTQCDGYAAGKLFMQGAELKNLEFIQYHPTTMETPQKRMLISEAVRGEGGRLFQRRDGQNVYFMEDKYGPGGNLMTRDIVSREIDALGGMVYLDISFLDRTVIDERLPEVRDICAKYGGIDVSREPIPVMPSVHFFMGGLAVGLKHETNIHNLFAVGECASMYHGANRIGGNSLLAAIYSGNVAADEIAGRSGCRFHPDFEGDLEREKKLLARNMDTQSQFPVMYIRDMLAETMQKRLGIVRSGENLEQGLADIDYYLSIAERIRYDSSVMPYFNYSLTAILTLARATITCALSRRESRGAHYRSDFPQTEEAYQSATIIAYDGGGYNVRFDREQSYES